MRKQTYISVDGRARITPLSGWLKIKHVENITPRHGLYYWALNQWGGALLRVLRQSRRVR